MNTKNRERLLIADDDANLLASYVAFFNAFNFEVRTATDGQDALGLNRAWHPLIVMLDIQMPRLDGREVARKIRERDNGEAPLLMAISGLSGADELAQSIDSGFDHHFVKPAQLPILLASMTAWQSARSPKST